ncbi:Aryl-phospho-beta-D-glucosidase BglC, GH1 family [Ruminococcus sp. YE71]|uniref:glycoside hydrolase family 5 protein n=1 Tax=unclassified Ruminococcus TaxID=2608920 RepID=UPI00088F1B49|nr:MULTISPECIES: cellulase family glycosylhydrolase [unclassified Ruminococcus]SDA26751.1 Aryl-phospho-beta-D-glucosidase BglC, GH1 family [Ruminococcus sp. YE78]SFW44474.1 Aryl-phospho-beta-D-glucosidase BglC, GH1 family [Ruminococcus sp. YE71]
MKKKIKGRVLSALSAAALTVAGIGSLPTASIKAEALSGLDANGIVSQMRIGWNLGNTLECNNTGFSSSTAPSEFAKAWGQPEPAAAQFQAVKDAGFNTVRIPVTWYEHLENKNGKYHVNDAWMDYVHKTVDYAIDRDMFVILNIHHEDFINEAKWTDSTYAVAEQKLSNIWEEIAEEFKDYDQHLIFEGMNEPRQTGDKNFEWGNGNDGGYSWNYVNKLNAKFVSTVRSQGSNQNRERLLMLPGYCASSDETAIRNIAIPANAGNVALSVHAYAPYFFTMDTGNASNHNFPGSDGYGNSFESSLDWMFNYLGQIKQEKNVPIIIGEFSASDFGNTNSRVEWAKSYLNKAKAKGIPCVLWDNNVPNNGSGEAHGYLHRKSCKWYPNSKPVIEAMMSVYGIYPNLTEYYVPPFSWSNINVGSDWIQLYKSENGQELAEWKNIEVKGWQNYANDKYDFVVVYKSNANPELVLMDDKWNRIASSDESDTPYVKRFSYQDLCKGIGQGKVPSQIGSLFISATSADMTVYGLFAVPKQGSSNPDPDPVSKYPVATASVQGDTLNLSWTAVQGAEKYVVAYYSAGKWRVLAQGNVLSLTKTKIPAGTYKLVVGARFNGQWDISNINSRAFTVTINK